MLSKHIGAEIDLVIKMPSSEIWAVEVKHGVVPKLGKHLSSTCDDVGASKKYVVYGDDITVISLKKFMDKIQSENL